MCTSARWCVILLLFFALSGDRFQEPDEHRDRDGGLVVFPAICVAAGDLEHGRHGVWGAGGVLPRYLLQVSKTASV